MENPHSFNSLASLYNKPWSETSQRGQRTSRTPPLRTLLRRWYILWCGDRASLFSKLTITKSFFFLFCRSGDRSSSWSSMYLFAFALTMHVYHAHLVDYQLQLWKSTPIKDRPSTCKQTSITERSVVTDLRLTCIMWHWTARAATPNAHSRRGRQTRALCRCTALSIVSSRGPDPCHRERLDGFPRRLIEHVWEPNVKFSNASDYRIWSPKKYHALDTCSRHYRPIAETKSESDLYTLPWCKSRPLGRRQEEGTGQWHCKNNCVSAK
jgi:hypothetical protein